MAAVSVVLPWSMCPMVPTLTCGLSRSNFSFATAFSSSTFPSSVSVPAQGEPWDVYQMTLGGVRPAGALLDDLGGHVGRHLVVLLELHGVGRASLRHRSHVGGVAEHLRQRHQAGHRQRVPAPVLPLDAPAAP